MEINKPLVSVIMSTYNEEDEILYKSIESIIKQSYRNLQIIIVNDNPEKNIKPLINELSDSRIQCVENPENKGLIYSLNRALSLCNGEMIARMDADDICHEERIEKQIGYLYDNNLDMVGCDMQVIDYLGHNIYDLKFPSTMKGIVFFLRWGNCVPHPTWLVKKLVYEKLLGYRNVPTCEDYDFVCRVCNEKYRIGNLKEKLLYYRVRNNGISQSNLSR